MFSDGHKLGQDAQRLSGQRYYFLPTMRRIENSGQYIQSDRSKIFVCPGRIEKAKGVFDLLAAFHKLSNEYSEWSLKFIGDGSASDPLRNEIDKQQLADRVSISGFVPRERLFSEMAAAAAVVIPSHADSLPLTFGEAMQLRRPVIVTDVGDLGLFARKFTVGTVVEPNRPDMLADALEMAVKDQMKLDPAGFDRCIRELDCDTAANRFAGWLQSRLSPTDAEPKVQATC
jgi:glycosyltransferase involved in cell wall biosynthesis